MAVRSLTSTPLPSIGRKLEWSGLASTDTGQPADLSRNEGLVGSVQFTGTFGGGTVVLEGTNDGTNYFTLKDAAGSDISATAAAGFDFSVACLSIRPRAASTTSIACTVILRG